MLDIEDLLSFDYEVEYNSVAQDSLLFWFSDDDEEVSHEVMVPCSPEELERLKELAERILAL